MKIIGHGAGRDQYLVEMNEAEIARAAGYDHDYASAWKANRPADSYNGRLFIGSDIDVLAAYSFHARVSQNQDKAREAAGTLRALAALIDGSMPDVLIPPPATAEPKEA